LTISSTHACCAILRHRRRNMQGFARRYLIRNTLSRIGISVCSADEPKSLREHRIIPSRVSLEPVVDALLLLHIHLIQLVHRYRISRTGSSGRKRAWWSLRRRLPWALRRVLVRGVRTRQQPQLADFLLVKTCAQASIRCTERLWCRNRESRPDMSMYRAA